MSWANAVFMIGNVISVPQEKQVSSRQAKQGGLCLICKGSWFAFSKSWPYLTICCWIISAFFKRINGVAEAGGSPCGWGEHSFHFEFREYPWCWNTLSWPTKSTLFLSICVKSQVAVFNLRMEVGKWCCWWRRCLWDLQKSPVIFQIN